MGADDDAVGNRQHVRHIVDIDAGIGEDRHALEHVLDLAQVGLHRGLARQWSRYQDRIGKRGEDRTLGAQFDRALVERMGEFGIDVEQELHVAAPKIASEPRRTGAIGLPYAHVGSKDTGEDLAHEFGAGRGANRDTGLRIPQIIDTEGHFESGLDRLDDRRHGGHAFERGRKDIRSVILIAEHDGIDAALLQLVDILQHIGNELLDACCRIIERRARQGPDMGHGDDGLLSGAKEIERHVVVS